MAKKKKMPKAVKASAPLSAHLRNAEKIKDVLAYNSKLASDEKKKKQVMENNKKLRSKK